MIDKRSALLHAACLTLLAAGVLIAFSDVLGPDRGLFFRDHLLVFKPRLWFTIASLKAHQLPASPIPAEASGIPYEMLLNATYVPSTLLFFIADFDVAYDWFVMSHLLILGIGIYGFASSLGASKLEALAAAAASFSGPILSFENLLPALSAIAWTPWVLWGFRAVVRRASPRSAVLLAFAAALQVQGIMPEIVVLDLIGAGAVLLIERPKADRVRIALALAVALVLACALAAVEIAPVLERLPETRRGRGFNYGEATFWSLQGVQLVELLAPSFWAQPENPVLQMPKITGGLTPYLSSLYLGSFLFLAICALAAKQERRRAIAFFGVAVLFLLVAMGTPLHRALASLPLLRQGRYPVKYLMISVAALAALAPLALRTYQRSPRVLILGAALQCVLAVSLLELIASGELRGLLGRVLEPPPVSVVGLQLSDCADIAILGMRARVLHALLFGGLLFGLAVLGAAVPRIRLPVSGAIAAVVVLDLASAGRFSIAGAPIEPSGPPPAIRSRLAGLDHRTYAIVPGGERPAVPHHAGRTFFEEQVSSSLARGDHLYRGVRTFGDFDPDAESNRVSVLAADMVHRASPQDARAILARAGVRFVTSPKPDPALASSTSFDVPGEAPQWLMELESARPYATAHFRAKPIAVERMPLRSLISLYAEKGDAAVVLDPSYRGMVPTSSTSTLSACAGARIAAVDRGEGPGISPVEVRWEGTCPAIVTILETDLPGWRALVDGTERPILPVEIGFMGVEVEPGAHEIRFEYVSRADRWVKVSIAALVLSLMVLALGPRLHRIDRRPRE
jgi:hypothetical protein